jgi:MFS family permease
MNPIVKYLDEVAGPRKKELLTILFLSILQGFLWTMMIPTIPLLAKDAGVSELQLGIITAIPAVITIICGIPGSSLGLRYGKRTLLIWSQTAGFLSGFLFYCTKNIGFIFIPQISYGISSMLFWPTQSAYQTEVIVPEKRATVIGYTMALSSLGSIVSPIVAGSIIDRAGYKPVFILFMAMAAVGICVARTLPKTPSEINGSVVAAIIAGYSSIGELLKKPMIQTIVLNTFLQFITLASSESFVSAFMRELNYSATLIGLTVTLRTTAMTLVRLFMGPLIKKFGTVPVLFFGIFSSAIAAGLVPLFPTAGFICASCILVGLGFGVSPVLTSTIIAEHTDSHERGMAMALNNTATNAGRTTTGFGFGAVASMVGYGPAIMLANCLVFLGSIFTVARYSKVSRRVSAQG